MSKTNARLSTGQAVVLLRGKRIKIDDNNPAAKILQDNEDMLKSFGVKIAPNKASLDLKWQDPDMTVEIYDLRDDPFISVAA